MFHKILLAKTNINFFFLTRLLREFDEYKFIKL